MAGTSAFADHESQEGLSGRQWEPGAKPAVERAFGAMRARIAWAASAPGPDALEALVCHACANPMSPVLVEATRAAVASSGGVASFEAVAAAVGSRVIARFAVLQLIGAGALRASGYLTARSLISTC